MRFVTTLIATLLAALMAVPAAFAAEADVQDSARKVRVRAAVGEANQVTVSRDGSFVTIADTAADITAGLGCDQIAPREVACAVSPDEPRVDVELGDGDDEATILGGLPVDVDAGSGDDTITSRDSIRDEIVCGEGADEVVADVEDAVAEDCETVDRPLAPPVLDPEPTDEGSQDPDPASPVEPDPGAAGPATPDPKNEPQAPGDEAPPIVLPKPAAELAEPGRSVGTAVKSGTVMARVPGSETFVPVDPTLPVPVGTVLDTTDGVLTLTAAADLRGATQTADFTGGRFRVTQARAATMTTVLRLTGGSFKHCRRATASGAVARAAGRRRAVRKLWGSGKGRFRTRGRSSAATVRGTVWTVEDRCRGTLTKVSRGVVVVENVRTGRTKVVRAGESHFVRRKPRRR